MSREVMSIFGESDKYITVAVGGGFEPPIVQGNSLLCLPIPPPYIIALISLVSPIPPPTLGIKFRERKSSNSLSTLSFPN